MEKILDKNIPVNAQLELTWRCNQRCIHCYQFSPDNYELSTYEIKDIIAQLAEAGTLYLSFSGGEPLLREDFWQIAEFASKKHFALELQTNGMLIDRQTAQRIAELNFFVVHISLLGATAETHDKITQVPGSFKKVLRAVKLLQKEGTRVILNTTLMKGNFEEYPQIKSLKERLGDIDIRVSPYIFLKNDGGQEPAELRLDDQQLKQFFLGLRKEAEGEPSNSRGLICNFGRIICTINARGKIYPCVAVPVIVGDLKKQGFKDAWSNSVVLKRIRAMRAADLKKCRNCDLADWCFRCSAFPYLETGDMFECASEPCRIAKITKEVNEYEEAKV